MHAIRQYELGGPEVLLYEEVPDLEPGEGQVRIAVNASGVHYSTPRSVRVSRARFTSLSSCR